MTALREVLAEIELKVKGLGDYNAARASVERTASALVPTISAFERARIKAQEYGETAQRLANKIRQLQRAEGDNSRRIEQLRAAHVRASEAQRRHLAEANRLRGGTDGAASSGSGLASVFGRVGVAMAAAGAAIATVQRLLGGTVATIAEVIEEGDSLAANAQKLGISTTALQEWQYVAERSNVSAEAFGRSFQVIARQAAAGKGPFRQLGVAVRDSNGNLRTQEAIFSDTVAALAGVENRTQRAALAQAAFGRSGAEMLPLIDAGIGSIEELRARFAELGGGLSEDVIANAQEADDAMIDFRVAMLAMKGTLVTNVLPAISRIVAVTSTWIGNFVELTRTSSIVQTALGGLAVVLAVVLAAILPFALPTLILVGALAALFLVVEDVVTAFRGGESVFGSFVEQLFEALGVTVTFSGAVDAIGVAWTNAVAAAKEALADLLATAEEVQRALGIGDLSAASARTAAARQGATSARGNASSAEQQWASEEASRRWQRQQGPAVTKTLAERGRSGRRRLNVSSPITINGAGDPQAVARAVVREQQRTLREAADTLPLAEAD